jgi:glycosyltransferase involved in cell wall biosynthesis
MSRRLLYVVNIPRFFVSHRLPLALAARQAGYEVHVATSDVDPESDAIIEQHGVSLHRLPLEQHGKRPTRELRTLLAIIRLLQRLRPDLLHLVTIKPVLYGGLAARLTGRRAVVAAMSGLGRAFRDEQGRTRDPGRGLVLAFRVALSRSATHVLVQNQEDLDILTELGIAAPTRSSVIAGSGVDLDRFRPDQRSERPDGPVTFLYAGRLMRHKGLGDFVEVARRLAGAARFVIAGYAEDGSPDAVPVAQVQRWADEGLVEWLGSRDDMPQVIADSDVVVLPTVYGEGVPKTLIEAAACARAIVTTDTAGCRDICVDGVNGLLVSPGDVDQLERALRTLIGDAGLRRRMGTEGRRIAEERFGLDGVIDRTLALYTKLLAAGS